VCGGVQKSWRRCGIRYTPPCPCCTGVGEQSRRVGRLQDHCMVRICNGTLRSTCFHRTNGMGSLKDWRVVDSEGCVLRVAAEIGGVAASTIWYEIPIPDLGGLSPRELLFHGRTVEVLEYLSMLEAQRPFVRASDFLERQYTLDDVGCAGRGSQLDTVMDRRGRAKGSSRQA